MITHLFIPDTQIPFVNKRQVRAVANFIKEKRRDGELDKVHQVGDLVDYTSLGRWVRNKRGEFDTELQQHIDEARRLLEKLTVDHWKAGNHDVRLDRYVEDNAPALSPLVWNKGVLSTESLFGLDDLGVRYERDIYEFAPDWCVAHGDEGPLSNKAGETALKLSSRVGKSVVCGHTHRAGLIPQTESFNGRPVRTLFGLEVGNWMNMNEATYLKGGFANWQCAFGWIEVSNLRVQPHLVFISQTGSFTFRGESWDDTGYVGKESK